MKKIITPTGATLYKSKYTANYSPVYISENMSGKMAGFPSISTAVCCNKICKARATNPGSICAHCFAAATVARYSALRGHLVDNYELLTGRVLSLDELPIFTTRHPVRLESFGDLANRVQAVNYLNIARANPENVFTIWTKNPAFIDYAIETTGKPANLICIISSENLNEITDASRWAWVDHVFTVYTPAHIEAAGVDINCGARDCGSCMKCYTVGNPVYHISEKLK